MTLPKKRVVSVHQAHVLPRLHYLNRMVNADVFVLLDEAQIQGRAGNGFEQRTFIKVQGKKFLVTVPVHGKQKSMRECTVAYEMEWPHRLLKMLEHEYGKAPFFDELYPVVRDLLLAPSESLFSYNDRMIRAFASILGITALIRLQSEFDCVEKKGDLMLELTQKAGGDVYHCGAWEVGKYTVPEEFAVAGIGVWSQGWVCPEYCQGKGEFLPNLSVIDALFWCGVEKTKEFIE